MIIYVVRRPFRSFGKVFTPGEIVEDLSTVKLPRVKIGEGKFFVLDTEKDTFKEDLQNAVLRLGEPVRLAVEAIVSPPVVKKPVATKTVPAAPTKPAATIKA